MAEATRPTIFSLSSGRPPAAIAVVRISGARAGDALKSLIGKIPAPRHGTLARVCDPRSGEIIDEALALWFPAPHSETGEDTAELQLHGGRAVIAAVLDALSHIGGLKPAQAGEFTRRAFEKGKLDLTAVEGLADLVSAETESQRRQAFRQMKGLLGGRAETWRQRLIQALALVEAAIDFSDEGDVPDNLIAPALTIARELEGEIASALADDGRGERLRNGLVVAIAGPPNAGKSTLLNRLARREAAIVSPYAGTTRDVIEVHLDLGGWPVTLLDTAGIRETSDPVELEGVRRARDRAAAADLVLWLVDASDMAPFSEKPPSAAKMWLIRNKIDLLSVSDNTTESTRQFIPNSEPLSRSNKPLKSMVKKGSTSSNEQEFNTNDPEFNLSATSGEGFDRLLDRLAAYAESFLAGAEQAVVTRARHRFALEEVLAALRRVLPGGLAEDLLAEELRIAAWALGRLTGRVDVEDILDVIFRDFCIGK
jgi:tRNA modification GTPase